MAVNGSVPQGSLNRLRASVNFSTIPALNVTAPFLMKAGIVAVPASPSSNGIDTMTGQVTSPEPYQKYLVSIHINRASPLAAAFKAQVETLCDVGDFTVRGDSSGLPDYQMLNGTIINSTNPSFAGTDPTMTVEIQATYQTNTSLWNA